MDRNLVAFLAIAKEGNLSNAAGRVSLAQPSLTKRLANLEDELGAQLFERHRRGMRLTTAGKQFLARATRIEQEYRQAAEEIRSLNGMGLDTLRVGAGPLFHLRYVAPLFSRLRERFRSLTFNLVADQNAATLPMLLDGKLDVVLGTIEPLAPDVPLETVAVAEIEHSVVMAADDPMAGRGVLKPRDLIGSEWVAYSAAADNIPLLRKFYLEQGLGEPKIIARSTSFATALDLTRQLRVRMMAPLQLAPNVESAGLIAVPSNPAISRLSTGVYVRQSSMQIPVIRQLLDDIRDLARR